VYGFARGPGLLPEIMNVGVGSLRLRFRGLAEQPVFTGHDAVLLPFDTYQDWLPGLSADGEPLLHDRARAEIRRATVAGVTVGFLYEDCFAHWHSPEDLGRHSLGAQFLAELGLVATPLPGPTDDLEALVPCFAEYLRRFGVTESRFEARDSDVRLLPLVRTSEGDLTGVAGRTGSGDLLFLPGDPGRRFLEFFVALGAALRGWRAMPAPGSAPTVSALSR